MAVRIELRNNATGEEDFAYKGYSWTSFFFGGFPALYRGDIKIGLMVLGVTILTGIAVVFAGIQTWVSTGIIGGIWGFFYNDIHLDRKLREGYQIVDSPAPVPAA